MLETHPPSLSEALAALADDLESQSAALLPARGPVAAAQLLLLAALIRLVGSLRRLFERWQSGRLLPAAPSVRVPRYTVLPRPHAVSTAGTARHRARRTSSPDLTAHAASPRVSPALASRALARGVPVSGTARPPLDLPLAPRAAAHPIARRMGAENFFSPVGDEAPNCILIVTIT